MAALGTFFLGWLFAPLLPAGEIASYIAGLNRGGSFESIPDRSPPPVARRRQPLKDWLRAARTSMMGHDHELIPRRSPD